MWRHGATRCGMAQNRLENRYGAEESSWVRIPRPPLNDRRLQRRSLASGGDACRRRTAEAALHGDLIRPGDEAALVGVAAAAAVRELVGEGAADVGAEDRGEV